MIYLSYKSEPYYMVGSTLSPAARLDVRDGNAINTSIQNAGVNKVAKSKCPKKVLFFSEATHPQTMTAGR